MEPGNMKQQVQDIIYNMSNGKEIHEKNPFKRNPETLKVRLNPALKEATQGEQWKLGDRKYRDLDCDVYLSSLEQADPVIFWLGTPQEMQISIRKAQQSGKFLYPPILDYKHFTWETTTSATLNPQFYSRHPYYPNFTSVLVTLFRSQQNNLFEVTASGFFSPPYLTQYEYHFLDSDGNLIVEETPLSLCHFPKASKISVSYPKQGCSDEAISKKFLKKNGF